MFDPDDVLDAADNARKAARENPEPHHEGESAAPIRVGIRTTNGNGNRALSVESWTGLAQQLHFRSVEDAERVALAIREAGWDAYVSAPANGRTPGDAT